MVYSLKTILVKFLIVFLGFSSPLSSDSTQTNNTTVGDDTSAEISMAVSNLVDDAAQSMLMSTFEENGISDENIKMFMESVNQFNKVALQDDFVLEGFSETTKIPLYDEYAIADKWDAVYPNFLGNNCRLTVFDLFHDKIKVKQFNNNPNPFLLIDNDVLKYRTMGGYSDDRLKKFNTFFGAIPAILTKDVSVHVKEVKEYYKTHGIEFSDTRVKIITVWFHDDLDNALFVGHTGLLMAQDDGFIFVEKLAFQAPYQVVKFKSKQDLNDYLMQKYDIAYGQPTAKPFIMENQYLLDVYKLTK